MGGKAKCTKIREALKPLFSEQVTFVEDIDERTAVVSGAAELAEFLLRQS